MKSDITPQQAREQPDPTELVGQFSLPVLLAIIALFAWGVYYIITAGPVPPAQYGDKRTKAEIKGPSATGTGAAGATHTAIDGAAIYAARCAACHQPTGTGLPSVFPPLAGSEWVNGNEAIVIQVVLHGVQGALTVQGAQYNMIMPPVGAQMSDAEIAAVATYVRSQWGNTASAVALETVTSQRAASAERTAPWSETELTKLR